MIYKVEKVIVYLSKRLLAIFIFVLLNINLILFQPINSELKVGDSFIYEIKSVEYYIKYGSFELKNEGYYSGGERHPPGTKVNATIEEIAPAGISFRFWLENYSSIGYINPIWLQILGVDYSYTALYHAYQIAYDYHYGYLVDLYLIQIRPYINPLYDDYVVSPRLLGENIIKHFDGLPNKYSDIVCQYDYYSIDNLLYFESWVGGWVKMNFGDLINDQSSFPSDIIFGNNFHFTVDKETGIIFGLGRRGWVDGTINNISVKISMSFEYELDSYDLPDYSLGSYKNFFRNDKILTIVFSTVLPGILVIVVTITFSIAKKNKALARLF